MPVLKTPRHEKFVQLLFEGEPAVRAYELAGYCDETRLRQFWQDLSAVIDDIRARSAKPVTAVDPSQVKHKQLAAERRKLFGGNSRQR
jgi:hypothetical protein